MLMPPVPGAGATSLQDMFLGFKRHQGKAGSGLGLGVSMETASTPKVSISAPEKVARA